MVALRRYVLLQIPEGVGTLLVLWALHRWAGVSLELAAGLFGLWVVFHVVEYPFVREAYRAAPSRRVGPERLVGARAVAVDALEREGAVRLEGELWSAELAPGAGPIAAGARLRVRAVRGLTLVVAPDE